MAAQCAICKKEFEIPCHIAPGSKACADCDRTDCTVCPGCSLKLDPNPEIEAERRQHELSVC